VFMSQHCAFAWSPKVLRAGQGAHFHLAIFEGIDLGGWARAYRGKVIAMVAAEGTSLYDADLTGPVAIAIGNEGAGLSDDLVAAARSRVTIPMPGGFESLNAAAAAAISLYECVRQRSRVEGFGPARPPARSAAGTPQRTVSPHGIPHCSAR